MYINFKIQVESNISTNCKHTFQCFVLLFFFVFVFFFWFRVKTSVLCHESDIPFKAFPRSIVNVLQITYKDVFLYPFSLTHSCSLQSVSTGKAREASRSHPGQKGIHSGKPGQVGIVISISRGD